MSLPFLITDTYSRKISYILYAKNLAAARQIIQSYGYVLIDDTDSFTVKGKLVQIYTAQLQWIEGRGRNGPYCKTIHCLPFWNQP